MTHGKPNGLAIHHTRGRTRVTLRHATIWTHTGTLAQAARRWTVEGDRDARTVQVVDRSRLVSHLSTVGSP